MAGLALRQQMPMFEPASLGTSATAAFASQTSAVLHSSIVSEPIASLPLSADDSADIISIRYSTSPRKLSPWQDTKPSSGILDWLRTKAHHWSGAFVAGCQNDQHTAQAGLHNIGASQDAENLESASFWTSGTEQPETWSEEEKASREIPQYVLDHTPYVHLFSGEQFWPCDIADHLVHTSPYGNYTPIEGMEHDRTVDNLDDLNSLGRYVYLHSDDNVEDRPNWLGGSKNIPDEMKNDWSRIVHGHRPKPSGGYSSAPAVLVVIPKEDGIVDAFWFYFYSYNLGPKVLNVRFGNHVGDWEHSMVRFQDGKPQSIFLSEHNFGEAYGYEAVEKIGKRPVIYSATGTHAMYGTPGLHPYVLPLGILHDQTDRGPLWDPLQNNHAFMYNLTTRELKSSAQTPKAPVHWFNYRGRWGDKIYPMSDKRQYQLAGQYHYVSGPLGPMFKNLGRKQICQGRGKCVIKHWLGGREVQDYLGVGTGEDMDEDLLDDL